MAESKIEKNLKMDLKSIGYRLTHGYDLVKRTTKKRKTVKKKSTSKKKK